MIPPLTAANGDKLLVSFSVPVNISRDTKSLVASGLIITQHISVDGSGVITTIADPVVERHVDVAADAATDPALTALMNAMLPALQTYVLAKNK